MSIGDLGSIPDIINSTQSLLEIILEPRGLNAAIIEGHKQVLEKIINDDSIDNLSKIAFLSNYKKIVKEYKNCRSVTEKALKNIKKDSDPNKVEEDWYSFFFDKVRLVSDEVLQTIWSQILSGEINIPGSYSRSLLHTLSIMSTSQALLFSKLAQFCLKEYQLTSEGTPSSLVHPLVFISTNRDAYKRYGFTVNKLLELERIGLINCDFKDEFVFMKKKVFQTGNKIVEVHGDPNNKHLIKAGNLTLTADGQSLYRIIGEEYKQYSSEHLEHIITKFQLRNCEVLINGKRISP